MSVSWPFIWVFSFCGISKIYVKKLCESRSFNRWIGMDLNLNRNKMLQCSFESCYSASPTAAVCYSWGDTTEEVPCIPASVLGLSPCLQPPKSLWWLCCSPREHLNSGEPPVELRNMTQNINEPSCRVHLPPLTLIFPVKIDRSVLTALKLAQNAFLPPNL